MPRMGAGASVRSRLYLEGYHVDNALIQIQASGSVGGPATCQLSLVPTNTAKHIVPGTWVHVFVTDPWDTEVRGDLSDFKLLFEGIVIGRGFTRETDGRHLVVQCADPSIFWVNARQFWLSLTQAGGGLVNQLAIATSGGYGRFVSVTDEPVNGYFVSNLAKVAADSEERFLDTMISTIDDIGNVNPFYNNSRNRFRITDRVLRAPAGKTDQLFQMNLLGDFMNGLAGRKSGQTNLAQLVNLLLAPIYHEWVSVLGPSHIEYAEIFSRDSYGNIRKIPVKKTVENQEITLSEYEKAYDEILGGVIFKPQIYTLSPPTCNVLFPNMYDHQSYAENFMVEPTRLAMEPQFPIKELDAKVTGLMLRRPTELEIVSYLTNERTRDAAGKFGDGASQAAKYSDFDWTTNEERVRGIVYNFLNLPPAASTLMLTDQGKTAVEGLPPGVLPYLQNVASYEFYKSKYQSRTSSFTGPFNMRPVPGFPILALDDSEANMSMVAYLAQITHVIDNKGVAQTTYEVKYPRIVDEIDWNRPIYEEHFWERNDPKHIATDENNQFRFERLFDGKARPAIPEWFGDDFRKIGLLDQTYASFFGRSVTADGSSAPVTSVESFMFADKTKTMKLIQGAAYPPSEEIQTRLLETLSQPIASVAVGAIDMAEVVTCLNEIYKKARNTGRELEEASKFTARPFAKIDQAFRFVGARPENPIYQLGFETDATDREYDYGQENFDRFVGDSTPGSGYRGIPLSKGAGTGTRLPQMSSTFPKFDTTVHSEVTEEIRAEEGAESTEAPRYDGRPKMFDFERDLWHDSLREAGESVVRFSTDQIFDENGNPRTGVVYDPDSGLTRDEYSALFAEQRAEAIEAAKATKNMTPEQQAPTGSDLKETKRLPVPEPLSEKQVIELRRRVVEAYRDELRKRRGFTG